MTPRQRTVRCVIDIDVGLEPIRGMVSSVTSPPAPFLGWLELVSALDRVRRPAAHDEEAPANRPGTEE